MYLIDYDDQDVPVLSTWDVSTGGKTSEVRLERSRHIEPGDTAAIDVYIEARLLGSDEAHLLALSVPKYHGLQRDRVGADGFADVIRVSDGTLVRSIKEELCGQPFHNTILYLTDNWVALRYGWGVPLFAPWQDRKINLTKPHRLTADETKFVLVRCRRSTVKSYHGPVNTTSPSSCVLLVFVQLSTCDRKTTLCTKVHCAVKILLQKYMYIKHTHVKTKQHTKTVRNTLLSRITTRSCRDPETTVTVVAAVAAACVEAPCGGDEATAFALPAAVAAATGVCTVAAPEKFHCQGTTGALIPNGAHTIRPIIMTNALVGGPLT